MSEVYNLLNPDAYLMEQAVKASEHATCNRASVGAVLVSPAGRVLVGGCNDSIPGSPTCKDDGCLVIDGGCKRTIHAEMNVLISSTRLGIATEGCRLYVTHYPCPYCMQHIAAAGIKEVVYKKEYHHRFENDFHTYLNLRQYG